MFPETPEGLGGLMEMMKAMSSEHENIEKSKKPICMASKEVRDEFKALVKLGKKARDLKREAEARSELLWIKIRSQSDFEDMDHLGYDTDTGMITGCTSEDVRECKE